MTKSGCYAVDAYWLSAVMLAILVLCVSGSPVRDERTESLAGVPSGEEEVVASDLLSASKVWDSIIGATKHHKQEFEDEFKANVEYNFLEHYKTSSLPAGCRPNSNLSMEACLCRLAQGLHTYLVLFKHVEKECPGSLILLQTRYQSSFLINLIKEKMRHPERVSALNKSQEESVLRELDNPNTFHRKMTAHSILRQLHMFLVDGKRAVIKREMRRGSMTNSNTVHSSVSINK
ncbi:hypothetical protein PAMA_011476 [Pampus argenteus]